MTQKTFHVYKTDKELIIEKKQDPEASLLYAVNAGTKHASTRVSYRKMRGILRHIAEKQMRQGILIFGTGNTDFYYIVHNVTAEEIFNRLEHDHTVSMLRIRCRY